MCTLQAVKYRADKNNKYMKTNNFASYVANLSRDLDNCIKAIKRGDKNPYLLKIRTNLESKLNNLEETKKEYDVLCENII